VNWTGRVIRLPERDYNWMNNLAHRRHKYDGGESEIVLLAKGYREEMELYHDLINGRN
jgi:hypothetical protein